MLLLLLKKVDRPGLGAGPNPPMMPFFHGCWNGYRLNVFAVFVAVSGSGVAPRSLHCLFFAVISPLADVRR